MSIVPVRRSRGNETAGSLLTDPVSIAPTDEPDHTADQPVVDEQLSTSVSIGATGEPPEVG